MNKYLIYNKDNCLGEITVNEKDKLEWVSAYEIPFWLENIDNWLSERAAPLLRENMANLFKECKIQNIHNLIHKTSMISLSDTIWIKEKTQV